MKEQTIFILHDSSFILFFPPLRSNELFGGSSGLQMQLPPYDALHGLGNSRLQIRTGAANNAPKNKKIKTDGRVGTQR
jgi:hypothetical protein